MGSYNFLAYLECVRSYAWSKSHSDLDLGSVCALSQATPKWLPRFFYFLSIIFSYHLIKDLQTKNAVTFLTHNISGIGGVRYVCIKMILAHVIILAGGKSCRNFSQGFSYWKVTQKFTHFARWNAKYACATLACPN